MRLLRSLLLLVAAIALAGCSAAQFAYKRLDFLARWEVGKYVDLNKAQRERFDRDFRAFWDWHRQHELPRYSAALRQIAARVDTPPDTAELARWSTEYSQLWTDSLERLMPMSCALLASLDDAQVKSLMERVDDDIDDYRDEFVDRPDAELRKEGERSLNKSLRRWLGELTPAQKDSIHHWNATRPWVAAPWLEFRRHWRDTFAAQIAQRGSAGFCPQFRELAINGEKLWTPEQQQLFAANRARWIELFARLGPSLNKEQRVHLREQLLSLADDLDALAKPPATATPDAAATKPAPG